MTTPIAVKRRLQLTADLVASRHGYRFSPDCKTHVSAFLDNGVTALDKKKRLSDEISIKLAEAAVTALVERMVEEARAKNLPRLQETTFFAAKSWLCPLWPFC